MLASKFVKVSVVYFSIGVLLGLYMSIAHTYTLTGVHVHINLIGWASMALAGIIYHMYPNAANSKLATYHFWGVNIGLPLMMVGLTVILLSGSAALTPVVSVGGVLVVLSVLLFAYNVLTNVKSAG